MIDLSRDPDRKPHYAVFSIHPILLVWLLKNRTGWHISTSITLTAPEVSPI